jgi:hypothetical protein
MEKQVYAIQWVLRGAGGNSLVGYARRFGQRDREILAWADIGWDLALRGQ